MGKCKIQIFSILLILLVFNSGENALLAHDTQISPDQFKKDSLRAEFLIEKAMAFELTNEGRDSSYSVAINASEIFRRLDLKNQYYYSLCLAGSRAFYGASKENGIWALSKCIEIFDEQPYLISGDMYGLNVYDPYHFLAIYYKNISTPRYLYYIEKGIERAREIGDHRMIAWFYNHFMVYHIDVKQHKKALEYSQMAFAETFAIKDSAVMVVSLMNIGDALTMMNKPIEANDVLQKALKLSKKTKKLGKWEFWLFEALGHNYMIWNKADSSRVYFEKALEGFQKIGNPNGEAITKGRYARLLYRTGEVEKSIQYRIDALNIADEEGLKYISYLIYDNIIWAFDDVGLKDSSSIYQEEFIIYKDSMLHVAYEKQANSLMKLEKIRNDQYNLSKEDQLRALDIQKEEDLNDMLFYGVVGLGGVFFFVVIGYRQKHKSTLELKLRNKQIVEQNKKVEEQRDLAKSQEALIKEAHLELKSSIEYSKRIQRTILPPAGFLKDTFTQAMTWYRPKEIVSGDFYWMRVRNGIAHIAIADSQGTGVAAAMISMVGYNGLNNCVRDYGHLEPAEILEKFNEYIVGNFNQAGTHIEEAIKIGYCKIDLQNNSFQFAGAQQGMFLKNENGVFPILGDKRIIGSSKNKTPFTNHTKELHKGDEIYLVTRGYTDQKGGSDNVRFSSTRVAGLISDMHGLHMEDQKNIISQTYMDWKGNNEQDGDICVVGIRI